MKNISIFLVAIALIASVSCAGSGGSSTASNRATAATSEVASADNNWDGIIADLDSYVDSYIKLLEKANKGEMSALAESAQMLEKAEAISKRIEGGYSTLTSEQLVKYMKVVEKLSNALIAQ